MPELKQKIILGLISLLESQTDQTELYITKQEGEVFAFCRFDKDYQHDGSGVEYFGSMNVGRKGQALGTSFFETVLEREKKGVAIDADCVPSSPVSSAYVERYGFVMTQVLPNYSGDDTLMAIQRREQNQQYHYREGVDFKDREALKVNRIELIKSAQERNNEYDVEEDHFVLMFDYPPREGDITIMEQIVNKNGYHITRYFPSRSNQKDITLYVAFEKPMTSDSVNQKGIDQETFTELFGDN